MPVFVAESPRLDLNPPESRNKAKMFNNLQQQQRTGSNMSMMSFETLGGMTEAVRGSQTMKAQDSALSHLDTHRHI